MEAHFAKIRTQMASKLANQQMHATTLLAVEETLKEQGAEITPTAYFATLMSLLDQQKDDPEVEEMRAAILNLLAIVFPSVPVSVLRSQYTATLSVITTILALQPPPTAPSMRSLVTCLEHLLIAQDSAAWNNTTTLKALQTLLILSLDSRPKPRKRAQEAVRNIVTRPPLMMIVHPGMKVVVQTTLQILKESGNGVVGAAGSKDKENATQMILHTLQLVRMVGKAWPVEQFLPLCDILLHLPKLNNPYLTSSAFQVFESLLSPKESAEAPTVVRQGDSPEQASVETMDHIMSRLAKITQVMSAVLELKPNANDATLMPLWLDVVRAGFVESSRLQDLMRAGGHAAQIPQEAIVPLAQLFKVIFPNLDSSNPVSVHNSTVDCLNHLIRHSITDEMIDIAVQEMKRNRGQQPEGKKKRNVIDTISITIKGGFDIRYQSSWLGVLDILKTLFERLNHAANPLLVSFLPIIDELRFTPAFTQKAHLDVVLSTAISTVGPRIFLDTLPLNIDNPEERKRGRAWLLPLLKSSVTNTELEYFATTLIPLADRLNEKAQECRENGMMKKVYETLIGQVWSLVSGFCDLPVDMEMAFTKEIAERFSNVLYSVPDLRPVLCQALTSLVVRNQAIVASSDSDEILERKYLITKEEAARNIELLQQYSRPYLMVFFNIFQATLPQFRGYLLEVMRMYLSISTPKDLQETFSALLVQLNGALTTVQPQQADAPPASHNLMDLADIMVPYVDAQSMANLYSVVASLFANDADGALQKKAYKIVNSMAETETGRVVLKSNLEELMRNILDTTAAATATAKRARLSLIGQVISLLEPTDLYFVPSILSEVVVATKEVNEKTRDVAYALLVAMGHKMKAGGVISAERVGDMEGGATETAASISEYFTMVTAGLAGTTPHMVSAAITSLSRLLFEFHKDLEASMVSEMVGTMHLFVNSSNREIVKSALGFIKVTTVSLDVEVVRAHLPEIVSGMIRWSHEHKGHFKVKVRHILERLVRRFGYDDVVAYVPEADKKLLVNIKKRRERAKRNKKNGGSAGMDMDDEEGEEGEEDSSKKSNKPLYMQTTFGSAYEDALYGSESDLSDDDEDEEGGNEGKVAPKKSNKKKQGADAWIKEDGDTPVDFLDRTVVSRVTASHPSTQTARKLKDLSSSFKTSSDGKLMIEESDDSENEGGKGGEDEEADEQQMELDQAENNYLESLQSMDGFTRGQGGKIKFNKTNKRGLVGKDGDTEMEQAGGAGPIRNSNKAGGKEQRSVKGLGQDFKAKKAGGDVKKKGRVDPYAYVPLTSLRKGAKEGLSLTNKSKAEKRKQGKPGRRS
ncbi:hypothetical protein EC968_009026 [Mortierella alpina]|nr:hypothetical protein EC968_009026 [Mortierella alpina]